MAESPHGGRKDPLPDDSEPPRLITFDDGPGGMRDWLTRAGSLVVGLGLAVVLGAATLWGVRTYLGSGADGASEPAPFAAPPAALPTTPASTPNVTPAARSVPDRIPTDLEAPVGTTLELSMAARDPSGMPLPDTLVRFVVESGTGTLQAEEARTDSLGIARVLAILASRPERMVVLAEVVGADLPSVRITVTGLVGAPQRIAKVGGDQQVTDAGGLLEGLVIRVTDGAQNPVPGVQVFFEPAADNGLVAPSRARTDTMGMATAIWRLGADAGVQRLRAEVAGTTVPPVTFTATALGDTTAVEATEAGEDPVEAPLPEPEPDPVVVVRRTFDVGGTFVCSLASGRPACRGANDRGQLAGGGGGSGFVGLAVGVSHACGLDVSGAASCWGANDGGQLGDGSRGDRTSPVRVVTDLAFSVVTAGAGHTCGLDSDGHAACWGRNLSGQLGDGTREDRSAPTPVSGGRSFRSLAAGWEHTCGLGAGGELVCWGNNAQGQVGDGSTTNRLTPRPVEGSFQSVVAGSRHSCGISGQEVLCWGDNSFGQLGDGSTESRTRPTPVVGLPSAPRRLAAGAVHTCALLEDGDAWCWGQNVHGQLGDASTVNRVRPSAVAGGRSFSSLFAGGALTCGFTTDGAQYCWGLNQTGQLGDGTRENRASPTRVGG